MRWLLPACSRWEVRGEVGSGGPASICSIQLTGDASAYGPVMSLGHLNPQGLAFGPDGLVLAVEHGTDENDEIRIGANRGHLGQAGRIRLGRGAR